MSDDCRRGSLQQDCDGIGDHFAPHAGLEQPVIAFLISFITLFFLQNVFNQQLYKQVYFNLHCKVLAPQ